MSDDMFDCECALCKKHISSESQEKDGAGGIVSTATMENDREFWYGLSGMLRLTVDLGLKAGDRFCYACMKKNKNNIEDSLTLACSNCGKLHAPVSYGADTGHGCAASCYEKDGKLYVCGNWGSRHDGDRFDVYAPVVKVGDVICDECVDLFREEGTLIGGREAKGY